MKPRYGCTYLLYRLLYDNDGFSGRWPNTPGLYIFRADSEKETRMRHLRKLWRNQLGQDMIEYALLAAFLAVAVGALSPTVATDICTMFSRVATVLTAANATGG